MKSEIIAVGSEMLTPYRQDTNSLYLTEKLNEIGVTVAFKTIVGDRRKDLVNAIRGALGRTDISCHGRPGTDRRRSHPRGRRRSSLAQLRRDAHWLPHCTPAPPHGVSPCRRTISSRPTCSRARRCCPTPTAARPASGSTPIFAGYRKLVMLLPGPPHECHPLFDAECLPRLRAVVPPRSIAMRTLKAAMIPESQADKLLAPIYSYLHRRRNHSPCPHRRPSVHAVLLQDGP